MSTWVVLTSRFLSVMGTTRIACLIKVYRESKTPNFGYVFVGTVSF